MKEQWKVYKITYTNQHRTNTRIWEVSNLGRVKCNGKIVEPYMHSNYMHVGTFNLHRAVAELFVPNPENKPCVDHINTDRSDNRACNLRWVTAKENCNNPLTRKHKSDSLKVAMNREDVKNRISSGNKGKLRSEETRKRMSESQKGKPNNFKGKTHTDEAKLKMSNAHKGKTHTEEAKLKMSASRRGKKLSEEHKQKISEARKEYYRKKRGN